MKSNYVRNIVLLLTIIVGSLIPITAHALSPTIVTNFNAAAFESPENIYIDWAGNRYVTMGLTGEVRKIDVHGNQSTFVQFSFGAPPLTPCNPQLPLPFPALLGIDTDLLGNFYFALKSCEPSKSGIWRKSIFTGQLEQLASIPSGSFLNGISWVGGYLYAADTFGAKVWRLNTVRPSVMEIWSADPLLAPRPNATFPGPNGLKYFRGNIYVSVSDTALVLKFRIQRDGSAGPAVIHATIGQPGGPGCDDFSFDILGNLYCGSDPFNTVIKVSPEGYVSTILTVADGLDGPSATFFGRGAESTYLYVTNGAFPFFSQTHTPSLMKVNLGIPGSILR